MNTSGRKKKYNDNFPQKAMELAAKGLIDKDIAQQLGISQTVFYEYKNMYPEFSEALKKGKQPIDNLVENALLKRALGYDYEEKMTEVKLSKQGKPLPGLIKTVTKHVSPDVTAQIFWLKNRKPKEWRDKQDIEAEIKSKDLFCEKVNEIPDDLLFEIADKIQNTIKSNIDEQKAE